MPERFLDRRIATHDPPPKGIPNPIHDRDGADAAGYAGALVAGIRTYGWAAEVVAAALGEQWLATGWADFTLRRPLYADEELSTVVELSGSTVTVECRGLGMGEVGERVVLDGTCGLGDAPFRADIDPPEPAPHREPPSVRPTYDLGSVPLGQPLRSLSVAVSAAAARRLVTEDLEVDHPRYHTDPPTICPSFLAGRMSPLTRHNFTYGPTIHVRSQIQHLAPVLADQDVTITAAIIDAYERNGHWYQVLDGVITGAGEASLAVLRHHTIFRPRGTTLPPPLGASA